MSTIFRECSRRAHRPSGSWRYGQVPKHPNTGNLKQEVQIASAVEGGELLRPVLLSVSPSAVIQCQHLFGIDQHPIKTTNDDTILRLKNRIKERYTEPACWHNVLS